MKYLNAKKVLPDTLVTELQRYIQGGYLYIPAIQGQKRIWGEASGYRKELQLRNTQIRKDYGSGASIEFLSKNTFCLFMLYEK